MDGDAFFPMLDGWMDGWIGRFECVWKKTGKGRFSIRGVGGGKGETGLFVV